MLHASRAFAAILVILPAAIAGCGASLTTEEGGEDEGGEESGVLYALDEPYNQVRGGARLILAYDAQANAFVGTVENTTNEALTRVRVEVHIANGPELGPTTPADLAPGVVRDVRLDGPESDFVSWNAHAEVGNDEHGGAGDEEHDGEGGEHDSGRGEHDGERGEHGESRGEEGRRGEHSSESERSR